MRAGSSLPKWPHGSMRVPYVYRLSKVCFVDRMFLDMVNMMPYCLSNNFSDSSRVAHEERLKVIFSLNFYQLLHRLR